MIKLSILVPSVAERRKTFLPEALDMLYNQLEHLPVSMQKRVEILFLIDNKTMMLGDKRNQMIYLAQGEYVVFVDCDDRIAPTYIIDLLEAAERNSDVICFNALVSINGAAGKICKYSKVFAEDRNLLNSYQRLPNHIPAVKRAIALEVPFPSIKYGEDKSYAKLLHPFLKTETFIDKILYYYDYNEASTVAQEDVPAVVRKRKLALPITADVVILSNAKDIRFKDMTQNAIDSCIKGANGLRVNIIVIEQVPGIIYKDAELIYHKAAFNYSAFNNLGAAKGKAPWIVFSNNDVVFHNGWLHELLGAGSPVVSPKEPNDPRQASITKPTSGFVNGHHLSPWCFMIKRDVFKAIGGWDEDFRGWFADDALMGRLKEIDILATLIPTSIVRHLGSQSIKAMSAQNQSDFAWDRLELYNHKYKDTKFLTNPNYLAWKASKK